MNETLEMMEIIRNNAKKVREENILKAKQLKKEARKELLWQVIALPIIFGVYGWIIIKIILWLAPMYF